MTIIKCEKLYKNYMQGSEEIQALKPTDLTVNKGEFVGLLGPSGSGKSTLLTILGALQKPSGGKIEIDGVDITQLSQKQANKIRLEKIGFILQSNNLIPFLTVNQQFKLFDKVAGKTGQDGYTQADKDKLCEALGIENVMNKYDANLSGGQKQRVAIARALYAQPSVILADEPTASLDSQRAFQVAELLKTQAHQRNTTIIMVTHDERLVDYFDSIYEMNDGVLTRKK